MTGVNQQPDDGRVVAPEQDTDEASGERALRPSTLSEFVGQDGVKAQLDLMLTAANAREAAADHVLLAGPPGLGKTTLAMISAAELGAPIRLTSGPTITHAGDLASILSSLQPREVLFIDEIHRIAKPAAEMLYLAMEDFRVDVMVGKGPGATSIPLELSPFTLIGATTRAGMLPGPLRDRFGFVANLDFYAPDDLTQLLQRSRRLLGLELDSDALGQIAMRSRGTPRIANRLLRRVADYMLVHPEVSGADSVSETLEMYEVDSAGLDRLDRSLLETIAKRFNGGPVGLSTLAASIGEERDTLESVVEPYLVRQGFISRSARGRVLTGLGYRHLGLTPNTPNSQPTLL